jgi:hypothetical protein
MPFPKEGGTVTLHRGFFQPTAFTGRVEKSSPDTNKPCLDTDESYRSETTVKRQRPFTKFDTPWAPALAVQSVEVKLPFMDESSIVDNQSLSFTHDPTEGWTCIREFTSVEGTATCFTGFAGQVLPEAPLNGLYDVTQTLYLDSVVAEACEDPQSPGCNR